jgi:hypothetical protein
MMHRLDDHQASIGSSGVAPAMILRAKHQVVDKIFEPGR